MILRAIRWRRWLVAVLVSAVVIAAYDLAALSSTAAKMLHHGRAFDWWRGPVSRSTIQIGNIPADVYVGARSRVQLLFVHGVNETGKDNADVKPAAEAFAGSGFTVVVPDLIRLKRQNVTPADIDDVVFVIRSRGVDTGIVCVSYGCGPALIAATRPQVRHLVRFIVALGGYFDLQETVRSIITGPSSPLAYSKWIYMAGNADLIANEQDRRRLIEIAAERRERPREQWTVDGKDVGPDARALIELFESVNAQEFDVRLRRIPLLEDRIERLSPSRYISGLRARLIVVHLRSDPSIPSTESLRMAEVARSYGIPVSLTILDMYGHTTPEWPRPGLRTLFGFYLPEGWKFVRVLREILSYS